MKNTIKPIALLLVIFFLFCLTTGCSSPNETPSSSDPSIPAEEISVSRIGEETLQYSETNEEYEYRVYETYVEIVEYLGEATDVMVPDKLADLPVKVVGGFSFSKIQTVMLPEGILVIKSRAFDNCDKLETINIPDSVREIGAYAFDNSNAIKTLTIPKGVTEIGERAFGTRYESRETLLVRFYKGTAAAEYIAKHSDIKHEIIDN